MHSYEHDLWNSLELVIKQFKEKRKQMKNYLHIISEKNFIDINYYQKLQKLIETDYNIDNEQTLILSSNKIILYYKI